VSGEGRTAPHAWDDPSPGLRLVVLAGGAPRAYPLPENGTVLLGRGGRCPIVIDDNSVSREHAALHVANGAVTVEDLGSRNGTRVGGAKIAKGERVRVGPNELFELGAVVFAVKAPSAKSVTPRESAPTGPAPGAMPARAGAPSAESPMGRAYALAELVAPTPVCVLLLGETGVGKTAAAERIHASSRRAGPLLKLNCAAVPEALLEGELFGYEKGAFTGAQTAKPGLIEAASNGTLLLDEIGDMPLATQAKLLHVVEQGEVMRLGALRPRTVDVRFIAATHRNLPEMVAVGSFRADLYYRINGIAIMIPPLRERPEEVLALAQHFLAATCARIARPPPTLRDDAVTALLAYPWPGNLRELRNVMDRVALLAQGGVVTADALGLPAPGALPSMTPPQGVPSLGPSPALAPRMGTWPPPAGPSAQGTWPPPPAVPSVAAPPTAGAGAGGKDLRAELDSFEKDRIVRALEEAGGNQTRAAQILGLPLRTFVKRLTHHGLTKPRRRDG